MSKSSSVSSSKSLPQSPFPSSEVSQISPPTYLDARYALSRRLVSSSELPSLERGISLLSSLLRAAIDKHGERSVPVACLAYEYG
eukprot:CAMPEP_0182474202 /NCGR_PEP_ID=MMETSP1319-20130603/25239_1 /TAXON_ID=172717 /ORGANISM="Bolidomonas pacifica, Strain RCC208" /LENGTH=84 /DNA_ID=CAMNT_0024675069 /DNA_START=45 /DNA_END=296 /DNA_ORIENTATION=-